jgi:hypothetical protein
VVVVLRGERDELELPFLSSATVSAFFSSSTDKLAFNDVVSASNHSFFLAKYYLGILSNFLHVAFRLAIECFSLDFILFQFEFLI